MSVASRKEFIACVIKSKAIPESKLTDWLEVVDEEDPKKIAAKLVRDKLLTAWQAKFLISGRSRLSVGNYLLRSRISRDQLGDKFEAIHSQLNRKVVIQVFPSSIAKDEALLKKLLKKLRQITELDHPNLIHIYDVDQESERYFLVTEHVEGETLESISPKDLTDTEIAVIVQGIASGLAYAHQSAILHGNVTAENIIVTPKGTAELGGFPSAVLMSAIDAKAKKPTESRDYLRLAKIGSTLLKEMPKDSRSEDFSEIAAMVVGLKDDDERESNLASLEEWVSANSGEDAASSDILLQPEDDSFVSSTPVAGEGDFDSPMATVPQTTLKKKKKAAETSEPESDQRGFVAKMWQDKRPAFIACCAALLLSVVGGLGYAFSGSAETTAENNAGVDRSVALKAGAKQGNKPDDNAAPLATSNAAEGALTVKRDNKSKPEVVDPDASRKALAEFFAKRDGQKVDADQNMEAGEKVEADKQRDFSPAEKRRALRKEKQRQTKNADPAMTETASDVDNVAGQETSQLSPNANVDPNVDPNANADTNANVDPNETVSQPEATPGTTDLTLIRGIGDKMQAYLNDGGVKTLETLSAMSQSEVQAALVKGNWKGPSRMEEAADWIAQAKTMTGDSSPMKESTGSTAATTATTAKPQSKPAAAPNAPAKIGNPFEKFDKRIDLPEPTETSDLKIGDLVIAKNHLLGLQLVAGPEIARNKIDLQLNRTENDKQLWDVELGVKRSDPIKIAQFQKTPTEMKFRWLPAAAESKTATALRNCMLKLSTPKDSHWLGLRTPVEIENFNFSDGQGFVKAETEIDSLPNPDAVKVELQPITVNVKTEEKRAIVLSYTPRQITKREPGRIFFHRNETSRFFYAEIAADIRKKSRFTAQMMLAFPNSNPQQVRSVADLENIARAIEPQKAEAMNQYQQSLNAKKPKSMETGEFNRLKKEAKTNADNLNKLATVSIQNIAVAKQMQGKKIKLEVYFEMEGHRIVLAESK